MLSEQDRGLLAAVKRTVQSFLPDAEIWLYGSVAKGSHGPESDYDLLVLTERPVSGGERREIERQILQLELANDVVLSTIYHTKSEWDLRAALPFHGEVQRHGFAL